MPGKRLTFVEAIVEGIVQRTIAFGHLHVPYVRNWRRRTFVNVASVGLPKDGDPRAHYAILNRRSDGWSVRSRRVAFDVAKADAFAGPPAVRRYCRHHVNHLGYGAVNLIPARFMIDLVRPRSGRGW